MIVLADIISATIVFAVPLLLVAMGGMFSERSGIINIALEGIMIIGALMGCLMLRWLNGAVAAGQLGGQRVVALLQMDNGRCRGRQPHVLHLDDRLAVDAEVMAARHLLADI
jgi:hypothetical protein